jgi:molybdenum cofactor cytidylyltransferase
VPEAVPQPSIPSDRHGPVAGIVLAAGASTRMGRNKLLLDWHGRPVVQAAVGTALAAGLDPVLGVLGFEADAVRAAVAPLPCRFVVNARHDEGMNRSVCVGVETLPAEVCAAVVLLADMPLVGAQMIERLVACYRAGTARLIVSEYDGVQAPPTLFDRTLFAELAGPAGRGCAKRMRRRHADEVDVVAWPGDALADLDVPADYERIRPQVAAH